MILNQYTYKTGGVLFPEIKTSLNVLDIHTEIPKLANISVMSATLEHLRTLQPGLDNLLSSTKEVVLLRTFLGNCQQKHLFKKAEAEHGYWINQYSFIDILDIFEQHGFTTTVIRDQYTDSLPKYLGQGVLRTQYVIKGIKDSL